MTEKPKKIRSYGSHSFPQKEDPTKCIEPVVDGFWAYQCKRKRGFGTDGLYCKQHSDTAVDETITLYAVELENKFYEKDLNYVVVEYKAYIKPNTYKLIESGWHFNFQISIPKASNKIHLTKESAIKSKIEEKQKERSKLISSIKDIENDLAKLRDLECLIKNKMKLKNE